MKTNKKVVDVLSECLAEELTAINQYFLHSEILGDWGYVKLHDFVKKEALDEMRHAEKLIERILFLGGMPDMSKYMKINIGKNVEEILKNDFALEEGALELYNGAIKLCTAEGDNGTADLLKQLLADEEVHYDWIGMQIEQIKQLGIQNYLTAHLKIDNVVV